MRRGDRSAAFLDLCDLVLVLAHWTGAADQGELEHKVLARFKKEVWAQRVVKEVAQRLRDLPAYFGIHPRMDPS